MNGKKNRKVTCLLGVCLLLASVLGGCGLFGERSGAQEEQNSPAAQAELIKTLQKQVRERDRRIADLTFQLEALKRIDQDAEQTRNATRPPAISPSAGSERQ
ncbi:MAG TPA: hypothetical protein VIU43_01745 [Nitrosospira sp.]